MADPKSDDISADYESHRSKLEVANHIKRLCKKNLNGFWEEISPLKTWSLFVELSECIGRENKKSESIEFFRSFVHQAVLLNAALVRINDDGEKNQIKNKINDLADQIVSNLASLNRTEPQHHDIIETTKAMKIHLTNMRKQAVTSVKNIPDCSSQSSEESKVRIIENIMKQITNDYNHLMKSISEECVKMLGDPHCQFAHLAMGSLSRGVVTPYSDFENGIVFEDTDEENDLKYRQCYFRSYAVLFEMIVVGFGEAPIRLAGIDCLNDFSTSNDREKDWFWDAFTTSGIQFDSHMPFASKTPLARSPTEKKPSTIELIGRKSDILEYLKQNRALKEGYHLAEMLAATSYVSGDVEFFNQYARDASVEMKKTFQSKESFEAMVHEYKRNLHEFSIDKEIKRYSSSLNVKKSLYRLFYVFLVHLERLTDVENHCNSSRYTIDHWLELNDGINKKAAHNLLYAFSLVNEARLKLYLQRTENADVVAGTMYLLNPKASTSVFSLLNKEDVVNAFAIGLSWNSALMEILPNIRKETDISTIKSYVLISLNTHLQQRHNFFQRGLILKHFQNYENALEAFRKCLNENDDKSIKVKVHNSIGQCHFGALQFSKASKEYESSLSIIQSMPEDIKQIRLLAEVQDWIGQCYAEIQPRDVPWTFVFAEKNLNESMDKWIHLRSEFPEDLSYTKGLADVLDSKGWMYYRKKDFENSLASYLEAAKLFDELESSSNEKLGLKDEIVNVQNGIALCYHELKRYKEAIAQMKIVIDQRIRVFGADAAVLMISFTKRKIGQCYMELEDFEEAVESYRESLRIREASVGSENEKISSYGYTTKELADCYLRMNDLRKAMETSKTSFLHGLAVFDAPAGPRIMGNAIELISKIVEKFHTSKEVSDTDLSDFLQSKIIEMREELGNPVLDKRLEKERKILDSIKV